MAVKQYEVLTVYYLNGNVVESQEYETDKFTYSWNSHFFTVHGVNEKSGEVAFFNLTFFIRFTITMKSKIVKAKENK